MNPMTDQIVKIILSFYPETQAIYLFGSYATPDEWKDSDVDVALLLPHAMLPLSPPLMLSSCHFALSEALGKTVDLVSAREVSTVMQIQIIKDDRVLYCADENAVAEFEMLTMSFYQKLNEERKEILEAFEETGRAYNV